MNSLNFQPKTLCILGRQPAIGLAELESLYGAVHVSWFGDNAVLDIPIEQIDFTRLGGTVKLCRVLTDNIGNSWGSAEKYLLATVPSHLSHLPEGKFTLGLSSYGLVSTPNEINKTGLKIKKLIKATGRPVRVVPNMTTDLSSAQVLHNQLTRLGGWELVVCSNGRQSILAQTLFVQDITAYAARDQARPVRDSRVGMLPPKLAQIIINLAIGQLVRSGVADSSSEDRHPTTQHQLPATILDPFCGTGVMLQEALLMGYNVIGADLEPRMIEYSKKNLDWLSSNHQLPTSNYTVTQGDATTHEWAKFDTIASETYLGRPLAHLPSPTDLQEIVNDVNTIVRKFLKNVAIQANSGLRLCLAVPAWNLGGGKFKHLPLIDQLTDLGYNLVKFEHVREQDMIYYRENQIVGRQLIIIQKK